MINSFLRLVVVLPLFGSLSYAQTTQLNEPFVKETTFFEEKNGLVAVEAEYFYKQTKSDIRQWFRTSKNDIPKVGRDEDAIHHEEASNESYIEILPDERVVHADKLEKEKNFTDAAGTMAVVNYKIKINTPGRYYVWARVFSTGSEDNGVHVGFDGQWPDNGKRMQWCDGKNKWSWASKQRTKEVHCGVPHEIYLDIDKAGIHDIQFSMREDGFEMDKFILTKDKEYIPEGKGPNVDLIQAKQASTELKESYFRTISKLNPKNKSIAAQEFTVEGTQFYKNGKNWLAINPEKFTTATTSTTFNFESGKYDLVFVGVGENDGKSTYVLLINDKEIGSYSPPLSKELYEEGEKYNALWKSIKVNKGDKIIVIAKVGRDDVEWTRGRWAGIVFAPIGQGGNIQKAASSFSQN